MPEELVKLIDESPVVYWLITTVLGLVLYRLAGLHQLWRHWPVTILFAAATAFLAFRPSSRSSTELREAIWYSAVWLSGALGYLLAERVAKGRLKSPSPSDDASTVASRPATPVTAHNAGNVAMTPTTPPDPAASETPRPLVRSEPPLSSVDSVISPGDPLLSAMKPLWAGRVAEGRSLLSSGVQSSTAAGETLAWLAWDCLRPPEDRERSWKALQDLERLAPGCAEAASIRLASAFSHLDYEELSEAYVRLICEQPVGRFGNQMAVSAWLCASDLRLQSRYRQTPPETLLVSSVLKGIAQLLERQHEAARHTFEGGFDHAAQFPAVLSQKVGRELTESDRSAVTAQIRFECSLGLALVEADRGQFGPAHRILTTQVRLEGVPDVPPHYGMFLQEVFAASNASAAEPALAPV